MWTCPRCKREFKRNHQSHYCTNPATTVDEYIAMQDEIAKEHLQRVVDIIRTTIPNAKERIAWGMPFFERSAKAVSLAACQKHLSLYIGKDAIDKNAALLEDLQYKNSAIYLAYEQAIPSELLTRLVLACFA